MTQVVQTPRFKKAIKKLHKNQKTDLDNAIKELIDDPRLGQRGSHTNAALTSTAVRLISTSNAQASGSWHTTQILLPSRSRK